MLHVPYAEQRQAHADGTDDAGVVGGALPDLHKLVSTHRREMRALSIRKEASTPVGEMQCESSAW